MHKTTKLLWSLVLDGLGYVSFIFPPFDFIWAPLSAYIMTRMYKGKEGKVAAIITFVEEALPYFDVIPSFTIMWFYTYIFSEKKVNSDK